MKSRCAALTITGDGEIKQVTGDNLQDWSVRQETNGTRSLVLRPRKTDKPLTQLTVNIVAERELGSWSNPVRPLALAPPQPALLSGYLRVEIAPELDAQPTNSSGLVPIETKFLPESLRGETPPGASETRSPVRSIPTPTRWKRSGRPWLIRASGLSRESGQFMGRRLPPSGRRWAWPWGGPHAMRSTS